MCTKQLLLFYAQLIANWLILIPLILTAPLFKKSAGKIMFLKVIAWPELIYILKWWLYFLIKFYGRHNLTNFYDFYDLKEFTGHLF